MTVKIEFGIPDISSPVFDRATGLMSPEWYRFFEEHARQTEKATTQVDANVASLGVIDGVTINAGNGINGGGQIGDGSITINADKNTGWTAGTGTANKGADASYAGHAASVAYVQAEAQATDDAVKTATQRIRAIENALRANGGIDG